MRFLVGTRHGHIFEVQIDGGGKVVAHCVYKLSSSIPIQGLCFEKFPTRPTEPTKYFVMAVTAQPTRYYQFVGGPTFELLFSKFGSGPNKMPARFNEFGTELPYSELHLFSKNYAMRAESFAMLTEVGILHGQLMFGSQNAGDSVVKGKWTTRQRSNV